MSCLSYIEFIQRKKIDEELVKKVIDSLLEGGVKFFGGLDENGKDLSSDVCRGVTVRDKEDNDKEVIPDSLNECVEAIANTEHSGYICMVHKDIDNTFDLKFIKDRSIGISIRNPFFSNKEEETMLNIIKCMYNASQVVYGYGEDEHKWYLEDGREMPTKEIWKLTSPINLKYIYSINIFGPEIVKKIGREKLLSAPSGKTEELMDGGILLMLGTNIFGSYDAVNHQIVEKHLELIK